MALPNAETDATIESLLEQRAQYEQWINRLEAAGEKAPPAVRQKVRTDYESRLQGVIQQLRGHAATITAELERHQATQGDLDRQRRGAEEALAEAEVRYAVGEFSDEEWNRISEQSHEGLDRLRGELRTVGDEIARLAEVQQLIGASRRQPSPNTAPAAQPPQAQVPQPQAPLSHAAPGSSSSGHAAPSHHGGQPHAPQPSPAPMVTHQSYEPEPVAHGGDGASAAPPPQSAPRAPEPRPSAPAPAVNDFDEMTFLKSVSEEERITPAPAGRRPSNPGSGGQGRDVGAAAPAAPSPQAVGTATAGAATGAPAATAAPAGGGQPKGGPAGVAKTLKCGECGTLNRPTEWYCERCGAELAAL